MQEVGNFILDGFRVAAYFQQRQLCRTQIALKDKQNMLINTIRRKINKDWWKKLANNTWVHDVRPPLRYVSSNFSIPSHGSCNTFTCTIVRKAKLIYFVLQQKQLKGMPARKWTFINIQTEYNFVMGGLSDNT